MTPSDTMLTPVRQIAAHELVVDQMRRAIESGQFRPGDRLPSERDMADQLDVSRTTVRAAASVLEHEGLLVVKRGRGGGFIVQAPTSDPDTARVMLMQNREAIREAFEFRSIVESAAARLAAHRRTEDQILTLRALLDDMTASLEVCLAEQTAHHVAQFQALDSRFHLGIAAAAHNPQLAEAVMSARRQMWMPVGSLFGRLEPNANDHHDEILDAIEAHDGDRANERMESHLSDTRRTLESWLTR
jgi:GntR family transcriptional regulator, transcriptional repressor for pyruvate dehydrogenase complex